MNAALLREQMSETLVLLRGAQAGDQAAEEALIVRFTPFVKRVISFLVGREHVVDVDDYVQECLWKAVRNLGTLPVDPETNFGAWLRSIARSVVLDDAKKWKRIKRGGGRERPLAEFGSDYLTSSVLPPAPGQSPSELAMNREYIEKLTDTIYELPEHQCKLILMRSYCRMSFAEIAEKLGIENVDTIRKSHQRAIQRIRARVPDPRDPAE